MPRLFISPLRLVNRGERAKVSYPPLSGYCCRVLRATSPNPTNTNLVVGVRSMLVLAVLRGRRNPKVSQPVVGPVPVDVINMSLRPLAIGKQPGQPVRLVGPLINHDAQVAPVIRASCDDPSVLAFEPSQLSCLRLVLQQLFRPLKRERIVVLTHGMEGPAVFKDTFARKVTRILFEGTPLTF